MINTIADLLQEIVLAETEILNSQNITHPTSIGSMYEGLTENILERSIFDNLDLRVVKNSFIIGCQTEFDVMLVEGDGARLPYTERFQYEPDQVIAIIQVKKNLYSKDINEGYENLKFIVDYYSETELKPFHLSLFRDAFRSICRKDISARKASVLNDNESLIFSTLREEAMLPIRMIWGYNGFKSELKFRESFVEYLTKQITTDSSKINGGYGPHNFPNLIICGKYSFLKNNGMPFGYPIQDNWWPFYCSSDYNPTYYFLELIWTRLSYKHEDLPMDIFGEDLTQETMARYIDCQARELDGYIGWEFQYVQLDKIDLEERGEPREWSPTELNMTQYIITERILKNGRVAIDNQLSDYVLNNYDSLEKFINSLTSTGLVFEENGFLLPLTDQGVCAILPDGRLMVAENKSGRFTNWIAKFMEQRKSQE